jgi:hypothetical protein
VLISVLLGLNGSNMDQGSRLYYIRKTIIQMLVDRGYLVTADLRDETEEDFKIKHKGDSL